MSTYAFGGSAGGPCRTNALTGEHEHAYSSPGVIGSEFAKPLPFHALTPEALAAVDAVRSVGAATRMQREMDRLVTEHGHPVLELYDGGVPANASKLERTALAAGYGTKLLIYAEGCRVEGLHRERHVGFTATWTRGRADGATWHERYRYGMVHDTRPVGVNARDHVGLKGKRTTGLGEHHLTILGSPHGLPITHTELTGRLS